MNDKIDVAFIVDDDQIYVFGLKKLIAINNLCKNILVFENGEKAMNYITPIMKNSEQLPDVILLDLNMPVMDGWEFLDEFVKIKPQLSKKIQIYMVSSSINPADIERAKQYEELSDYLIKPISIEELHRVFTVAA
ncbi:MAG: response regulator [Bacteroidetes bacterium]|nr:MAG: response regulator [Bacteroidota bacterium]